MIQLTEDNLEVFECPVCGEESDKARVTYEDRGYCSAKCMSKAEFPQQKLYLIEGTKESAVMDEHGQSITEHRSSKKIWAESLEDALTQWLGNPDEDRSQWFKSVDKIEVIQE